MAKKIKSLDEAPVDVVEAVKRGFIHRGLIPRKYVRNDPTSSEFELKKKAEKSGQPNEGSGDSPGHSNKEIDEAENKLDDENSGGKMSESESIIREKMEKERAVNELNSQSDRDFSESKEETDKQDATEAKAKAAKKEERPADKRVEKQLKKIEETLQELKNGGQDKSTDNSSGEDGQTANEDEAEKKAEKKIERNPMMAAAKGETNIKNELVKTKKSRSRIQEVKEQTEEVLYEAETVFPFTLFPDTLKLDREKFTMAQRNFFRTATISSVPVSEIMSIEANVGPFFGSLHLILRFFNDNEKNFTYLWRQDAINLQRLIHGFIIAHHKGIDLSKVPTHELRETLTQIGQGVKD